MASATARVTQPGNEEGRPGTGRPSEYINTGNDGYSVDAYRVQRLISIAGMSPTLAAVSAPLVFGGAAW